MATVLLKNICIYKYNTLLKRFSRHVGGAEDRTINGPRQKARAGVGEELEEITIIISNDIKQKLKTTMPSRIRKYLHTRSRARV